jgi:hypothetical protein
VVLVTIAKIFIVEALLANIGHWNRWGISFPLMDIGVEREAALHSLNPNFQKEEKDNMDSNLLNILRHHLCIGTIHLYTKHFNNSVIIKGKAKSKSTFVQYGTLIL